MSSLQEKLDAIRASREADKVKKEAKASAEVAKINVAITAEREKQAVQAEVKAKGFMARALESAKPIEPMPETKQETPFQRRVRLMKQTKAEQEQVKPKPVEPKQPTMAEKLLANASKEQAAKPSIQGIIKTKAEFESAKPEVKMVPESELLESERSNKSLMSRIEYLVQANVNLEAEYIKDTDFLESRIESLIETNKQLATEVEGMKEVEAKLNALSLRIVEVENANS